MPRPDWQDTFRILNELRCRRGMKVGIKNEAAYERQQTQPKKGKKENSYL